VPAAGALVPSGRLEIRLVFSEPVVAALSHIVLVGSDGTHRMISPKADPRDVHALIATIDSLATSGYRADWHIVSADGHPVSGSVSFRAGSPAAQLPADGPLMDAHGGGHTEGPDASVAGVAALPALLRGLALVALLSMSGLLAFGYSDSSGEVRRLATWLCVAACALFSAHFVAWLAHLSPTGSISGAEVRAAVERPPGLNEAVRLGLVLLVLWAILLARRWGLALVLAFAAVVAGGAIGHPAAIHPFVAIPLKSLHLVGVALWMGGITWLLTARPESVDIRSRAAKVSSIAMISIVVVAITGSFQGFLFLSSFSDLREPYGIALIGKTAGLVALAAFGDRHRKQIPLLDQPLSAIDFQRSLRRELALMALVVMLGGILAYIPTPPPR
jgi:copper transport protein